MQILVFVFKGLKREMASDRVRTALPDPPGQDEEEKAFANIFAELESVELPLGTTLRYLCNILSNLQKLWAV